MIEKILEGDIYTLTDDEDNSESEYEVLGTYKDEESGKEYVALIPNTEDAEEYVILRCESEDGDNISFVTVDDDDEFDAVADYFEDALFSEIDCDAVTEE